MAKKFGPKEIAVSATKPVDDDAHPWAETRDIRPDDRLLRAHGFTILARPKDGPTIWVRNGIQRTEREALMMCRTDEKAKEGK